MNLLNILLQTPIDPASTDTTTQKALEGITGAVSEKADSLLSDPSKFTETVSSIDWGGVVSDLSSAVIAFGLRLLAALVFFFVGKFVVKKIVKVVRAIFTRRNMEPSLSSFLLSLIRISLMFILIITVIAILGIETSSFIAIFASAGVAIGLALSGTLQNFAGGVLILLLKPYKVGDFIVAGSNSGTVKEIQIFNTIILTPNNERISIPNGGLSTDTITNYSAEKYRRVEWNVGISYGDSVDKAREVILKVLDAEPLAVKNEECVPTVTVGGLNDSAVSLIVRGWCLGENYWDVYFNIYEAIYNELPKNGINFPFPQMDVHVKKEA